MRFATNGGPCHGCSEEQEKAGKPLRTLRCYRPECSSGPMFLCEHCDQLTITQMFRARKGKAS